MEHRPSLIASWGASVLTLLVMSAVGCVAVIAVAIAAFFDLLEISFAWELQSLTQPAALILLATLPVGAAVLKLLMKWMAHARVGYLRCMFALVFGCAIGLACLVGELILLLGASGGAISAFLIAPGIIGMAARSGSRPSR